MGRKILFFIFYRPLHIKILKVHWKRRHEGTLPYNRDRRLVARRYMVGRVYTSTRSVTNMSKPYRRKKWDRNVNPSSSVLDTAPHVHFHVIIAPYPPYVLPCFTWYFRGGPPPYITGLRQGTPLMILC